MILLAKIAALSITGLGVLFVVKPDFMNSWIQFWIAGKRWYGIGVLRVALGIIFLMASFQARNPGVSSMLALVFLASGAFIFVIGAEKLKNYVTWWTDLPPLAQRLLGIVVIAFGVMMVFAL